MGGEAYIRHLNGRKVSWWPAKPEAIPYKKSTKIPGRVKVEYKDMFGESKGKRVPLRGGPLDGEQMATHLYVRTGRGKATASLSVPLLPDSFNVTTQGGDAGHYAWNDEAGAYWWVQGQMGVPDLAT